MFPVSLSLSAVLLPLVRSRGGRQVSRRTIDELTPADEQATAPEAGEGGVGALLRAPELYAWLAVALAGMVFQQASFRAGALTASLPTMTLAKPVVGWILGITVLSETLRVDDEKLFVLVAAVIVMIVSTVALARGEAATMEAVNKRRSKATRQPLAPSER